MARTSTDSTRPAATLAASFDALGLWPLRVLWFLLPLLAGPGFASMLGGRSDAVRLVSEVGLWVGWTIGLIALLAPSTASLTALRLVAPSVPAAALLGSVAANVWNERTIGTIGIGVIVFAFAFLASTGDEMVNGSSYGPERRLALRPPAALLLGPIQLTWLAIFAGLVGGGLLVAAENYPLGVPVLVVGIMVTALGIRSLHQLSRRWIVFVPAGFVIHDSWVLAESLLIRRPEIASLGPVPLDKGELLDLSGGAQGLALLVELDEPTPLALRDAKSRSVQTFAAHRIVFSPSLPGRLLHEARVRGIRIA